jgi:hypothetical protein
MILISRIKKTIIFITLFFLFSCETLNDLAGLSKPEFDNSLADATPELVLPPDFGKKASPGEQPRNVQRNVMANAGNFMPPPNVQSAYPRITNYIAPRIQVPSSSTPSDSLEQFQENRKFTIGEWVYRQYVDGFKQGNLYYRPVYDKGYNFSRRYVPDRNVFSFHNTPTESYSSATDYAPETQNVPLSSIEEEFQRLDQLPVLE